MVIAGFWPRREAWHRGRAWFGVADPCFAMEKEEIEKLEIGEVRRLGKTRKKGVNEGMDRVSRGGSMPTVMERKVGRREGAELQPGGSTVGIDKTNETRSDETWTETENEIEWLSKYFYSESQDDDLPELAPGSCGKRKAGERLSDVGESNKGTKKAHTMQDRHHGGDEKMREEVSPFRKSSKLARTPPKGLKMEEMKRESVAGRDTDTSATNSTTDRIDRFSPGETEKRGSKGSGYKPEDGLTATFLRMQQEIIDLCCIIRDSPDTRREVRAAVNRVRTLAGQLASERALGAQTKDKHINKQQHSNTRSVKHVSVETEISMLSQTVNPEDLGRTADQTTPKTTKSVGTQTDDENKMTTIPETTSIDEIKKIIDKEWDAELYKITKLQKGNPNEVKKGYTRIYIIGDNTTEDEGLMRGLIKQNPTVKKVLQQERTKVGKVYNVTDTISIRQIGESGSEEVITEAESYDTYVMGIEEKELKDEEGERDNILSIFENVKRIAKELEAKKCRQINVATTLDMNLTKLRKAFELALYKHREEIKVTIQLSQKGYERMAASENRFAKKEGTNSLSKTLEIKPKIRTGNTYAMVLESMKKSINPEELGIQINSIRKTEGGNIRLRVTERKKGALEQLKNNTKDKLGGMIQEAETIGQRKMTVIVRDIDPITTSDEVIEAIRKEVNYKDTEELRVNSMRQRSGSGVQVAVLTMNRGLGEALLRKRSIKIGWISCDVKELIEPLRCFRCGGYGHMSQKCEGEKLNMSGKCLKCCEAGHNAKECQNNPRCYSCEKEGHRAGTMACEVYRMAVKTAKKQ